MTINAFCFIVISAIFHVVWNSVLKACKDKTIAVFLMILVTVIGFFFITIFLYPIKQIFTLSTIISALIAGFFFFLYQYFVALAYEKGELTLVYPLTTTAPVYIAFWSYILIGEKVSFMGGSGILLIIYGAITIQTGNFIYLPELQGIFGETRRHLRNRAMLIGKLEHGVVFALAASFFYSFGAVADKMGVMTGNVTVYTFHLSLYMMIFHLIRIIGQKHTNRIVTEIRSNPWVIISGGVVMMLSLITFRVGLEEALASYASALRQISTLFGILIGFFIFRENITAKRVISSFIIVAGAVLLKIG